MLSKTEGKKARKMPLSKSLSYFPHDRIKLQHLKQSQTCMGIFEFSIAERGLF